MPSCKMAAPSFPPSARFVTPWQLLSYSRPDMAACLTGGFSGKFRPKVVDVPSWNCLAAP